jgi:hypothetical protein
LFNYAKTTPKKGPFMIPQHSDDHWLLLGLGLAAMAAQVAFSFVCAAAIVMPSYAAGDTPESVIGGIVPIASIFGIALALNIAQIFLHEMGHAVAAWSVKRRVHLICVGIVGYAPDIGKFMRVKKPDNAEYAGFVQASPIWPDFSARKSIWISAGGPLATGGLGLLIFAGAVLSGAATLPVLFLAAYFMLDAVVNLIPLRWYRGGGSDGLHILQYLGGHGWTADMWAETRLETAALSRQLVSNAEWQDLKPLIGGPFNSPVMNRLLAAAVAERGDHL